MGMKILQPTDRHLNQWITIIKTEAMPFSFLVLVMNCFLNMVWM